MQQVFANYTQTNTGENPPQPSWEGAPFVQIEPSMGYQRGLPLLLIKEKGVNNVGLWNPAVTPFLIIEWSEVFQNWIAQVRGGYYYQTEPQYRYGPRDM